MSRTLSKIGPKAFLATMSVIGWAWLSLALIPQLVLAENFTFQNINGLNFLTPPKDQGGWGTCGAHGRTGELEAKYKLTRNDPTFDINLSEQMDVNGMGWNLVLERELPYRGGEPYAGTNNSLPSEWPLLSGWKDREVVCSGNFFDPIQRSKLLRPR